MQTRTSLDEMRANAITARARATRALADLRAQLPGTGRMVAAGGLAGVFCGVALASLLIEDLPTTVVALGLAVASLTYCLLAAQRRAELQIEIAAVDFERRKADELLALTDPR